VTALIHQARCSPEAGLERSIIKIVAVYHTYPVVVVGETADGALLERSLHELADMPELLPPRLWQELVEQYHVFQSRWAPPGADSLHCLPHHFAWRHRQITSLSAILNEKAAISPEMAIRLEKAFGSTAETWLKMQTAYNLAQARQHEDKIKVTRYLPDTPA
jgi:antitoxin HigA-1